MKSKFLNLFIGLIINVTYSSYSLGMDENDFSELEKLEGFLNKNKVSMQKISRGKYKVNDDQFDNIFPPCHFCLGTPINTSVGLIENEFTHILSGKTHIGTGTGTIIKNDLHEIIVITAKHVLREKGNITFTLGSTILCPGSDQINYLAKYTADKVFFHNSQDVSYVKFNLTEKIIGEDSLRSFLMERFHENIEGKKTVLTYHYPFGIEIQRVNKGVILKGNNSHTIPTLGGSSGAPIIYNNLIIGIHTGVDEFGGGTTEFRGKNLDFSKYNKYVRMSDIKQDLSDFTERS